MSIISVRSRGELLTVTVACSGQRHTFTAHLDGTVTNRHHDGDYDAVLAQLGHPGHPCQQATNILTAATTVTDALIGVADPPVFYMRTTMRWRDADHRTCPLCLRGSVPLGHYATVGHQAARVSVSDSHVNQVIAWKLRNGPTLRELHSIADTTFLITPPYLAATARLLGPTWTHDYALALRERGVRVEWLTRLTNLLPDTYHPTGEPTTLINGVAAARNVDPDAVAAFVATGVRAHIYTYIKNQVTPAEALAVYRAHRGQRSLADYINDGQPAHTVLARMETAP